MSKTRLHRIYTHMKERCLDSKNNRYEYYGGRGIMVCKEWLDPERICRNCTKGWIAFKEWALSHGYADNLTIDRIDVNKGYSPENCRWVTNKEQCNNRRSNHLVTYKGVTRNLTEWCEELGLNYYRIERRLNKCHWSIEKAFETECKTVTRMITYKGKTQSLTDWCKELGLNFKKIQARLNICHWSIEKALETK